MDKENDNMLGLVESPTSSVITVDIDCKYSADLHSDGSDGKKAKKSKTGAKKKTNTIKRRTKPCTNKLSVIADPQSTNNHGQVAAEVYVVEKIVGKRMVDNVPFYLIKWKGWASVHNTWEPVENLDGCPGLLEKYEKNEAEKKQKRSRGSKKGTGHTPSECGSSVVNGNEDDEDPEQDSIYQPTDEMKKTRQKIVEFGILYRWPTDKTPVEVVGVLTVDGRLVYIVRWRDTETIEVSPPELNADNVLIIRASSFRELYPHLIIKFYETRLKWRTRQDQDQMDQKVARLMATAIMSDIEMAEELTEVNNRDENSNHIASNTTAASSSKASVSLPNEVKVNGNVDEEKMDVDEIDLNIEEDPPQQIFIRAAADLFGLPLDLNSSGNSSDEDENLAKLSVAVAGKPKK